MPPVASIGICGMLKPNVLPPTPGTQSGIDIFISLIFDKTIFMTDITALIGAFAMLASSPNTLPNIETTFPHAADQFPLKTLSINPIMLEKMAFMLPQTSCTLFHRPDRTAPRAGKREDIAAIAVVTAVLIFVQIPLIFAPSCAAFALTVSQFLYSHTPAAISAVIAKIAMPIGLVTNARPARNAFEATAAALLAAALALMANVCALVCAVRATVDILVLSCAALKSLTAAVAPL